MYPVKKRRKTQRKLRRSNDKMTVYSHDWWTLMFESSPVERLLVFLPARNKDRPTQLVFFLPPPSLGRWYRRDRPVRLRSAPIHRITHCPACPVRLREQAGMKEPEAGVGDGYVGRRDGRKDHQTAFIPVWKYSDTCWKYNLINP